MTLPVRPPFRVVMTFIARVLNAVLEDPTVPSHQTILQWARERGPTLAANIVIVLARSGPQDLIHLTGRLLGPFVMANGDDALMWLAQCVDASPDVPASITTEQRHIFIQRVAKFAKLGRILRDRRCSRLCVNFTALLRA